MTLASTLVEETRTLVLSDRREELTTLSAAIVSTTAPTFTVTDDLGPIRRGALISVDLEDMYVTAYDQPTKTVTILRGHRGSTAATHLINAVVRVNPHFSTFQILQALNADLNDLSGLIPYYTATTITYDQNYQSFALPAGVIQIYDLRWESTGTRRSWPRIANFDQLVNMDATEFAQGQAVRLYEAPSDGQSLRVIYRGTYAPLVTLADNVLTVSGLQTTAHDVPPLGAAARLVRASEVKRNLSEQQSETRRAEEVPPGARLASANGLLRLRAERVRTEANQVRALHPFVKRRIG